MKIIEKKCPNCGAGLEFGENDNSCRCSYCHRSFEIERDKTLDVSDIADQFNLNELKGPLKIFSSVMIGSYVIGLVVFLIFFGFVAFVIFKSVVGTTYSDISQFTSEDYGDFDNKAYFTIKKNDDNLNSFHLETNPKREKTYLVYDKKKKENTVYVVYKAAYSDAFKAHRYFVYVPIKYENLKNKMESVVFQLDDGKIEASEFYLTDDKSEYTYGYNSVAEFEKDVIDKLRDDNKVTEK